jgi:phosphatidylserine decarboxylase
VSGRVVQISRHGHRFMTSTWVSTHSNLDVLTENERLVMEFDSPVFGTVVQVSRHLG